MQDREDMIIINNFIKNDPLSENNLDKTLDLVNKIRLLFPQKTIWLYTGYSWNQIMGYNSGVLEDLDYIEKSYIDSLYEKCQKIISKCDVLVDGRYIDSQRDITLPYRGSKNQRLIDIQKSFQENKIVLLNV